MLVSGVYHVCVYLYVCIHVCIHICTYMCIYMCICVCIYVCVCVYIYVYIYIYIYILSQILFPYVHLCSVSQLCRILCDPMSLVTSAIQQVLVGYLSYR